MDSVADRKSLSKNKEGELELESRKANDSDALETVPATELAHLPPDDKNCGGGDVGQPREIGHNGTEAEEQPPAFAPYEAEHFLSTHGDIISHDHHLNEDGEALYRFLLTHASTPPLYTVRLCGTHTERRTRIVWHTDAQGHNHTHTEQDTVTVTDFSFALDLTPAVVPGGPVHWSVPDATPAYRGLMVRQVTVPAGGGGGKEKDGEVEANEGVVDWKGRKMTTRKATKEELAKFEAEEQLHFQSGAAPWEAPDGSGPCTPHEASSKTVREWADAYAASPKLLKEFVYEKTIYGWSTSALHAALHRAITDAPSQATSFSVDFHLSRTKIIIRPDARLARLMSLRNKSYWWATLLWIALIYPVLWLFRRYSRHGGGRWAVCGGAYALKIVEDSRHEGGHDQSTIAFPEPTVSNVQGAMDFTALPPASGPGYNPTYLPPPSSNALPTPYLVQPQPPQPRLVARPGGGMVRITGFHEGEWFRMWEPTIQRCVRAHTQQDEPLVQPDVAVPMVAPGVGLDGY